MLSFSAVLLAAALATPAPVPSRAAPKSAVVSATPLTPIARRSAMPSCPGANAKVILRCGSRMPTRGAVSVVIHECGVRIASIYLPGPTDKPVKKASAFVVHKPRLAGQPDLWEGKGFSLWISTTHPMADGRDLAGLDTTLLGGTRTIELACQ